MVVGWVVVGLVLVWGDVVGVVCEGVFGLECAYVREYVFDYQLWSVVVVEVIECCECDLFVWG